MEELDVAQVRRPIELLNYLEDLLEDGTGKGNFFGGKNSIDREEMLRCIQDIRVSLPGQLQQSIWIVEERNKILAQAQTDAKLYEEEVQDEFQKRINQHEVTKAAEGRAVEIIEEARREAREIINGAQEYGDELIIGCNEYAEGKLKEVEIELKKALDAVHQEVGEFEGFLGSVHNQLYEDRQQLKNVKDSSDIERQNMQRYEER